MRRTRDYRYDVFISHAVEDKLAIANELSEALEKKDLKVWYSGRELSVGDRLIETIYQGLEECRFGVVIISPTYITKIWALSEFFKLLDKEQLGQKVILPVLHDITPEEIAARFPPMADIVALRASRGIPYVVDALQNEINRIQSRDSSTLLHGKLAGRFTKRFRIPILIGLLMLVLLIGGYLINGSFSEIKEPKVPIDDAVKDRISFIQKQADKELKVQLQNASRSSLEDIGTVYKEFLNTKSYYRNEYFLNTGTANIRSKRNVERILQIDLDTLNLFNGYAMLSPNIFRRQPESQTGKKEIQYIFYNTNKLLFHIGDRKHDDKLISVHVTYDQPIRLVNTTLIFPSKASDTRRHQVNITAVSPVETYLFKLEGGKWKLTSVE